MRNISAILLSLLLSTSTAFADSVVLKSGMIIQGDVFEKTEDYIKINTGSSVLKIPFKRMDEEFASAYRALPDKIVTPKEVFLYKGRKISKENVEAEPILKAVLARYKEMSSFQCNGVGISNTDNGASVTTGQKYITIKFQRPDLYLITDKTSDTYFGFETRAAWHDGKSRYYYNSKTKKYFELPTDSLARMGIGYMNILFDFFAGCETDCEFIKDFSYFGNAHFNGELFYLFKKDVSSGSYMIWVSQSSNLIMRIDYDFEGHPDEFFARGIDTEAINNIFPVLGMEVTAEKQKNIRTAIKDIHAIKWGLKTKTYAEVIFDNINVDVKFKPENFKYFYPEDTTFESEEDFKKRMEKKEEVKKKRGRK